MQSLAYIGNCYITSMRASTRNICQRILFSARNVASRSRPYSTQAITMRQCHEMFVNAFPFFLPGIQHPDHVPRTVAGCQAEIRRHEWWETGCWDRFKILVSIFFILTTVDINILTMIILYLSSILYIFKPEYQDNWQFNNPAAVFKTFSTLTHTEKSFRNLV